MLETFYGRIRAAQKNGNECFYADKLKMDFSLLDFWRWSVSDLVSNSTRGRLAEFIVAKALGIDISEIRDEWCAFDLAMPCGTRIEVKSAAYIQSWHQARPSLIRFSIAPSCAWDAQTNLLKKEKKRQSDLYVFALLDHKEKATIDPMKLEQWLFSVVPTSLLNERFSSQNSVTLKNLKSLGADFCSFLELRKAVERVLCEKL